MNEEHLLKSLSSLRELEPRKDVMASLKKRVFDALPPQQRSRTVSPIQTARTPSPFTWSMVASGCVAFAVVLVVVNQLPMHGAYQDSLDAIVQANKVADTLDKAQYTSATASEIKAATQKARETLDTLKLKGQFATYTQAQCVQAYQIYDGYLDYLGASLDEKIKTTKNPADLSALKGLRAYVEDSHQEAQKRINMYPAQK